MPRFVKTYDEYEFGLTWVLDEPMQRASHALVVNGGLWLVDPVAVDDALERALALAEPAGVLQLLDRHSRECAKLAARYGVPHVKVPDGVSGFQAIKVIRIPRWKETALWWPEHRALIVAEVIGTNPMIAGGRDAGMHPMLRVAPPGGLRGYEPEHLLMGHGAPLHGSAAAQGLAGAYARSRTDIPRVLAKLPFALRG
jgi:hypothetical protein